MSDTDTGGTAERPLSGQRLRLKRGEPKPSRAASKASDPPGTLVLGIASLRQYEVRGSPV